MFTIRKANERGHFNFGWLDTNHTFSFGDYYDPKHMGYRSLRVINDDIVGPGGGFGMHPHRDMEIVTYVLDGVLEHKDSMGNGSLIQPGEVQRMSAGTGILHSEFNHSKNQPVHLLQIWIQPERKGLSPGYEQKSFAEKKGLFLVGSNNPRDGAVKIHQDVDLLAGRFSSGDKASYELKPDRSAWLHVATGSVKVNGHELSQGDSVAVDRENKVDIEANKDAQVLLFDLSNN